MNQSRLYVFLTALVRNCGAVLIAYIVFTHKEINNYWSLLSWIFLTTISFEAKKGASDE